MWLDQVTIRPHTARFPDRVAKLLQGIISFELHEERLRKLFTDSNAMNRQFDIDRPELTQNVERSTRALRRDKNGYVRLEQRSGKLPRQPPNFSQEHFKRPRFRQQPIRHRMNLLCHLTSCQSSCNPRAKSRNPASKS